MMSSQNGLLIESVRCVFVCHYGRELCSCHSTEFFSFSCSAICFNASLWDILRLGRHITCYTSRVVLGLILITSLDADPPAQRLKAEYQKLRSEQQAAAQSSGKRSQIDFTSSSSKSRGKAREHERDHVGTAVGRKSRFQPHGYGSGDSKAVQGKERERNWWG